MARYITTKTIKLSSIHLATGWRRGLDSDIVQRLQASVPDMQLAPVAVQAKTGHLIFGRHRIEALKCAGRKTIRADLWDVTDDEVADMRLRENLERHVPADRDAQLVELVARVVREVQDEPEPPRKRGRPPSAAGEARRRVAAATGVSERTVRRAEDATAAAAVSPPQPGSAPVVGQAAVALSSLPLARFAPVELQKDAEAMIADIGAIRHGIAVVLGRITERVNAGSRVRWTAAQDQLDSASRGLAGQAPVAFCPYCKCSERQATCQGCRGRGYVYTVADVPAEFLDETCAIVGPSKPAPKARTLNVVIEPTDDDGHGDEPW